MGKAFHVSTRKKNASEMLASLSILFYPITILTQEPLPRPARLHLQDEHNESL